MTVSTAGETESSWEKWVEDTHLYGLQRAEQGDFQAAIDAWQELLAQPEVEFDHEGLMQLHWNIGLAMLGSATTESEIDTAKDYLISQGWSTSDVDAVVVAAGDEY